MKKKNFFAQYKQFTFFLILAVVIILIAVFAPVVSGGVDPLKGSLDEALLAPSKAHIFGTDKMGRDIFARVIYGARASLTATFGVVALIFFIGTTLGVIAGYFGGIVDSVIMRIADMMLSFPGLVLALAVAGIMGASMKNAIVAVVVVNGRCARLAEVGVDDVFVVRNARGYHRRLVLQEHREVDKLAVAERGLHIGRQLVDKRRVGRHVHIQRLIKQLLHTVALTLGAAEVV